MIERFLDRDVFSTLADRDHHLDLVMDILGADRVIDRRAALHDRVGRLHEEKWRLAIRVVAHLARVFGVVAANAENAADWKAQVAARDRQRWPWADIDDVGGLAQIVFSHGLL